MVELIGTLAGGGMRSRRWSSRVGRVVAGGGRSVMAGHGSDVLRALDLRLETKEAFWVAGPSCLGAPGLGPLSVSND